METNYELKSNVSINGMMRNDLKIIGLSFDSPESTNDLWNALIKISNPIIQIR